MDHVSTRQACGVLLDLLRSDWGDLTRGRRLWSHEKKLLRQLIVDDLTGQSEALPETEYQAVWEQAANYLVPESVRKRRPRDKPLESTRHAADIVLLTVLPVERDAVLAALGEDPNRTEDIEENGAFYYRTELKSARYSRVLTIWTTMVGEPSNVPCAVFVNNLSRRLDTSSIILIGIAGGNKEKVKIGDVVSTYRVLDDDGGVDTWTKELRMGRYRLELRRRQPRVRIFDHEGRLKNLLNNFSVNVEEWHRTLQGIIDKGPQGALTFHPSDRAEDSSYKAGGLILAGERLKKDGSLPMTAEHYNDKLYAVEMEGSGFAQACSKNQMGWLVIRGIADLGDQKKRDAHHSVAASAAATLAVQFLRNVYQPPKSHDVEF